MGAADTARALAKAIARFEELHTEQGEVLAEIRSLMQGGASIDAQVSAAKVAFDRAWCGRYNAGKPGAYVWNAREDVPHLKRFVRVFGLDEFELRAKRYIGSPEGFYRSNKHPFRLLVKDVNNFATENALAESPLFQATPNDCRHTPQCKDDVACTARKRRELRTATA